MAKTDAFESIVLNYLLRGEAPSPAVGTLNIALFTADPTESGSFANEVSTSGTGYARQAVSFTQSSAGSTVSNTAEVAFPVATGNWGSVSHWAVVDITNSRILYKAALTGGPFTVDAGPPAKQMKFAAGTLQISEG